MDNNNIFGSNNQNNNENTGSFPDYNISGNPYINSQQNQNENNPFPNNGYSNNSNSFSGYNSSNQPSNNNPNQFYGQNIPNNNYIPPQNNYNTPFNRQYANPPAKNGSKGIYIILIAVIICFAVIIALMFTLMRSMIDGGNKKSDIAENNLFVAETTVADKSDTETTASADRKVSVVTTSVYIETVPEVVTVTVIVTEPVIQEPEFKSYTYSINNYSLAIYENAGYDSKVVGHINDRGTYTIVDQYQNWGKLKSGAGWINFDFASEDGRIDYIGTGYVSTQKDPLNLRYAPDSDSKIITAIPKNTYVEVYETDLPDWYYIEYNGKYGFASSGYITLGSPPELYIDGFYGTGVIATEKDPLNMRSEPSENSSVLATIPKGTSVDLYSTSEPDWFYTTYNGKSGFVKSRYISFRSYDDSYIEYSTAYINTEKDPLNLRESASKDSAVITTIPKGTAVTVIDYDDSWCYIEWNGYKGYASTQFLSF